MNRLGVRLPIRSRTSFPGVDVPESKKSLRGLSCPRFGRCALSADGRIALRVEARKALEDSCRRESDLCFRWLSGSEDRAIVRSLPLLLSDPSVVVIHGTGKQLAGNKYNGMADSQKGLRGCESICRLI